MLRTRFLVTGMMVVLLAGCGSSSSSAGVSPTVQAPAGTTVPAATVAAVATPLPAATASTANQTNVNLDAERTEDEGGYAFSPPQGWTVQSQGGGVTMINPKDDPTIPVGILIIGGGVSNPELQAKLPSIKTPDALFDEFLKSMTGDTKVAEQATDRQDVMIGTMPARAGTIRTTQNGQQLEGEAIIGRPSDDRVFVMVSLVPEAKWSTIKPQFDAVRGSVRLFEPKPAAATPAVEETPTASQ